MPQLNEIGRMIKDWLQQEGYRPEVVPAKGAQWVIGVTMPTNGWKHAVILPEGREDSILIQSGFTFSPAEVKFLTALPASRAMELLWEIRMRLLFQPTEFTIMPPKNGFPEGFTFTRHLSYDGLDRNKFMEGLREVHKCELFVSWIVLREQEISMIPPSASAKLYFTEDQPVPEGAKA